LTPLFSFDPFVQFCGCVLRIGTEVAKAFDLARNAVLDRRHAQAYRCAVYLLRRVVNESIAKVARRAGISAPRVSQIQAEAESARPQGPMRKLLDLYKVKR
jgi:hypothetical protein